MIAKSQASTSISNGHSALPDQLIVVSDFPIVEKNLATLKFYHPNVEQQASRRSDELLRAVKFEFKSSACCWRDLGYYTHLSGLYIRQERNFGLFQYPCLDTLMMNP